MNGWMDGERDRWMDGCAGRLMNRLTDGWYVNELVDEWVNRCMGQLDKQMDRQMGRKLSFPFLSLCHL